MYNRTGNYKYFITKIL